MLHFFVFYTSFYFFTRFKFVYSKDEQGDVNESVLWLTVYPFVIEFITVAWLVLELFDRTFDKKTSSEE